MNPVNPWVIIAVIVSLLASGGGGFFYGRHVRGLECEAATDTSVIEKLRSDLLVAKNNETLLRKQLDDLQKENDELDKKGEEYESGLSKTGACPVTQRDIDAD